MKIGFFGDSFCAEMRNQHSILHRYSSYIKLIKDHYHADIVNLGVGGSSCWDVILQQFPKFKDNLPDVCVFVWTDWNRLYHPKVRNIGNWVLIPKILNEFSPSRFLYSKYYKLAQDYYKEFYDDHKALQERTAALYHFDKTVLEPIMSKTKIIHCWSFVENNKFRFSSGMECAPALKLFSMHNMPANHDDSFCANHIYGKENNKLLSQMIIQAIDQHQNGLVKHFNFTDAKLE